MTVGFRSGLVCLSGQYYRQRKIPFLSRGWIADAGASATTIHHCSDDSDGRRTVRCAHAGRLRLWTDARDHGCVVYFVYCVVYFVYDVVYFACQRIVHGLSQRASGRAILLCPTEWCLGAPTLLLWFRI